jgi:hypothetical protein
MRFSCKSTASGLFYLVNLNINFDGPQGVLGEPSGKHPVCQIPYLGICLVPSDEKVDKLNGLEATLDKKRLPAVHERQ